MDPNYDVVSYTLLYMCIMEIYTTLTIHRTSYIIHERVYCIYVHFYLCVTDYKVNNSQ